jgi:NAD(P)-dependent dehydrogenase (short-subunit alcohol dehydrogenase family)
MPQTVLITGASSGLGRATAKLFHAHGWNVVATMRSPERETELTQMERMVVAALDVQDVGTIGKAVSKGIAAFGQVDVLVNNAGYGAYGPLEATPLASILRQFDVNVVGLLATTQALLPHFRAAGSGTIVNISSLGGRIAFPLGTLYHASKFAVEGLSEALQYELAPIGVRVKVVEPGFIATDFAGRSFDFSNDPALVEYQPLIEAFGTAMGPLTQGASSPQLIAETVFRAATDDQPQLRYPAGPDAVQLLEQRAATADAPFFAALKPQFGIPS